MASQTLKLVMRTGPNPGKSYELTKTELYIGRDVSNDIVVNDSEVSRKHARLLLTAGGYVLEDLGSTNGTFVNGQRLMGPHVLRPGETILLGENISIALEANFDADATIASGAVQPQAPRTASQPAPMPFIPTPTPEPEPSYSGQVPPEPAEPYYTSEPAPRRISKNLIYAGVGCLILVACACLAGAVIFDSMDMYCTPPFNTLFSFLYTCP